MVLQKLMLLNSSAFYMYFLYIDKFFQYFRQAVSLFQHAAEAAPTGPEVHEVEEEQVDATSCNKLQARGQGHCW